MSASGHISALGLASAVRRIGSCKISGTHMANALTFRSPYGLGSPLETRSYLSWMFLISALRPASGKLRHLLSFIWGMLDDEDLECPRSPAALNSRFIGRSRLPTNAIMNMRR